MARIVLPTDLSDNSLNACAYALGMFGTAGNEFILLHTYLEPIPDDAAWAGLSDALHKASEEGLQDFLGRFRSLKSAVNAHVRTRLRYGPLTPVVQEMSASEGVDLVVMGSQGETGLTFLGSNASQLARNSKVPVLIVPGEARFTRVRQILLADDHKTVEPLALHWLVELARRHRSAVVIGHVLRYANEEPDPHIVAAYDTLLHDLEHTFTAVAGDDVALALSNAAEFDHVDLIAVLHRHIHFLESLFHRSTTRQLAMHTRIPLLVLEH